MSSGTRDGPICFSAKTPHHPSLRFKKVDEESNAFSVRIGLGYRALGVMEGSIIVWFWIGSHADCDRLI
jgi:hypothetical protein